MKKFFDNNVTLIEAEERYLKLWLDLVLLKDLRELDKMQQRKYYNKYGERLKYRKN